VVTWLRKHFWSRGAYLERNPFARSCRVSEQGTGDPPSQSAGNSTPFLLRTVDASAENPVVTDIDGTTTNPFRGSVTSRRTAGGSSALADGVYRVLATLELRQRSY